MAMSRSERSLRFALERINASTAFTFHNVDTPFCPQGPFSTVRLGLNAQWPSHKEQVTLKFDALFEVEATRPEFDKAIQFIDGCRKKLWPVFYANPKFESDQSVLLDIVSEILVYLCHDVTLEKRYRSAISTRNPTLPTALTISPLGLGSNKTLYGTPDVRVGSVIICQSKESESGDDKGSVVSDGMTTSISFMASNMPQAVAACVVSSFTERASHPDKSLIPTILIDKMSFVVCLYDSEKDILLLSNTISLCTKGHLSRSGITLLWVVLHYK